MRYERHIPHKQIVVKDKEFEKQIDKIRDKADSDHGGYVKVVISTPQKSRTTGELSQNHHLNGHIQTICQETGNSFDDVKKYVKQQAIAMGYPMKYHEGEVVLDMWGSPIGISESDCSVEECSILIEATHILASELGIILVEE